MMLKRGRLTEVGYKTMQHSTIHSLSDHATSQRMLKRQRGKGGFESATKALLLVEKEEVLCKTMFVPFIDTQNVQSFSPKIPSSTQPGSVEAGGG